MSQQDAPLEFLHPQHWKRARGYANGVAGVGRLVFIAGQVGWNAEQRFESQDFVAQVRQALENIVAIMLLAFGRSDARNMTQPTRTTGVQYRNRARIVPAFTLLLSLARTSLLRKITLSKIRKQPL